MICIIIVGIGVRRNVPIFAIVVLKSISWIRFKVYRNKAVIVQSII